MKNVRLLAAAGLIWFCGLPAGWAGGAPERPAAVPGSKIYLDEGKASDYLELRPDGTFYLSESNKTYNGTYLTTGDHLTLSLPNGRTSTAVLSGDEILDRDSKTWKLQSGGK